jgi:hypothetical protein
MRRLLAAAALALMTGSAQAYGEFRSRIWLGSDDKFQSRSATFKTRITQPTCHVESPLSLRRVRGDLYSSV